MKLPSIPLQNLLPFSAYGQIFRAFDHLIAPGRGELLLVPIYMADGDLRQVIDGCPAPWEEVWSVIDTPVDVDHPIGSKGFNHQLKKPLHDKLTELQSLAESGWKYDRIEVGNSSGPLKSIDRLSHSFGIRYARIRQAA